MTAERIMHTHARAITVRHVEAQPASGPHRPAMPEHYVTELDGQPLCWIPASALAPLLTEAEARGAREVSPQGEWITAVGAERRRQREQGYTDEHDREQGANCLLDLAIEYGRRGEAVKAAALVQAARQVVAHAVAEAEARGARSALLSAADAIEAEGADYDAESTLSLVLSRLRARAEQAGGDRG